MNLLLQRPDQSLEAARIAIWPNNVALASFLAASRLNLLLQRPDCRNKLHGTNSELHKSTLATPDLHEFVWAGAGPTSKATR
jgi:hypothetical protein